MLLLLPHPVVSPYTATLSAHYPVILFSPHLIIINQFIHQFIHQQSTNLPACRGEQRFKEGVRKQQQQ